MNSYLKIIFIDWITTFGFRSSSKFCLYFFTFEKLEWTESNACALLSSAGYFRFFALIFQISKFSKNRKVTRAGYYRWKTVAVFKLILLYFKSILTTIAINCSIFFQRPEMCLNVVNLMKYLKWEHAPNGSIVTAIIFQ